MNSLFSILLFPPKCGNYTKINMIHLILLLSSLVAISSLTATSSVCSVSRPLSKLILSAEDSTGSSAERIKNIINKKELRNTERQLLLRRDALKALRTASLVTGLTGLPKRGSCSTNDEESLVSKPTVTLKNEAKTVPTAQIGKNLFVSRTMQGHWQLAGGHGKYNREEAIKNMVAYYKAGITSLDTSDTFGASEVIVGKFMKKTPMAVPCTKLSCYRFLDEIDITEVRMRIKKACEILNIEKLPLVALSWSNYGIKRYIDVALMLTELKEEGLIQEIGVTNFDLIRLKELKDAGVSIASHQVQLSCLDQRAVQSGMMDWCEENDVSLIAYGTVASGILSDKFLGRPPPTQEEKNTASMRLYSKTAERFGDWNLVQELLKTMRSIADNVQSSGRCPDANIANIAQRYVLDSKAVASIVVGIRNQDHLSSNVRTHSFQLTSLERDAINAVISKRDGQTGDVWDLERGSLKFKKKPEQ